MHEIWKLYNFVEIPVGLTIEEIEHDGNHGAEDTQQQQQNAELQQVRRAKKQSKAVSPVRADKLVVGMVNFIKILLLFFKENRSAVDPGSEKNK